MSRHMQERTTVRLPSQLLRQAKRKAAAQGRTLTSLIEDGLRLVVAEPVAMETPPRVMPRISTASGGLVPGIDLDDSASLQGAEDIAYVARLQRDR